MANEQHLALLKQGVEDWNQWRENNPQVVVDLSETDLSRANLNEANLKMANLHQVDLRMANLSEADLTGADLRGADLRGANLRGTNLTEADLTGTDLNGAYLTLANFINANLTFVNLSEANLRIANLTRANLSDANLRMSNLSGANLSEVNFRMANLSDANLRMANLSGANLERVQALDTNFNKAILTGACLANWQTNRTTNLEEVICDYVYLQVGQQERHPTQGNFSAGEFIQLWRSSLNPINLTAPNVTTSVQDYQIASNTSPNIPNVVVDEQKPPQPAQNYIPSPNLSDVSVDIQQLPPSAQSYTFNVPNVTAETQQLPQAQPISSQTPSPNLPQAIVEVQQLIEQFDNTLSASKWSEVAAEIHQLLQELAQTCPTTTPLEKVIVVAAAIKQLEGNLPLKARIINALQEVKTETLKTLINHPLSGILLSALEGWR